jgi:ribosome-binding factor A
VAGVNLFVPEKARFPRLVRVASEIKKVLSEIFQRQEVQAVFDKNGDLIEFPNYVTVTNVKISRDLRECKVWIMPFTDSHIEKTMLYFDVAAPFIRKVFAQKSKLRLVPNFHFKLDSSIEEVERITKLLNKNNSKTSSDTIVDI